jgi:hypothetical protein
VLWGLLDPIIGGLRGVLGNGTMASGIVIGSVLALIFRGVFVKLLVLAILAIVLVHAFGMPRLTYEVST